MSVDDCAELTINLKLCKSSTDMIIVKIFAESVAFNLVKNCLK